MLGSLVQEAVARERRRLGPAPALIHPIIPLHRLGGADCWEPSSVALPRWVIEVHRPESLFGTIDILFTFFPFFFLRQAVTHNLQHQS